MSTPNKERLRLWVEDLRTTEAKQTTGLLRRDGEYCCLGRACEVYAAHSGGEARWVERPGYDDEFRVEDGEGESAEMPELVGSWFGLDRNECGNPLLLDRDERERRAADLNDLDEYTFPEIAEALERRFHLTEP